MNDANSNGKSGEVGTVYLLHFNRPYCHASHYVGFSQNLPARLEHHRNGTGARLTAAASEAGIEYEVARQWDGKDRAFERRLHNQKHSARLCPKCNPNAANRMKES